jgi:hypothetical protein
MYPTGQVRSLPVRLPIVVGKQRWHAVVCPVTAHPAAAGPVQPAVQGAETLIADRTRQLSRSFSSKVRSDLATAKFDTATGDFCPSAVSAQGVMDGGPI